MTLRHLSYIVLPSTIAAAFLFSPYAIAQDTIALVGDPDKGRTIYQKVGYCVKCHGWPGDGISGISFQAPAGSSLRATKLDAEGLTEVIRCGIPGTEMPYHEAAAYRDDRCYGLVLSDFEEGTAPVRGKTFPDKQFVDLIAYLQAQMIGLGEPNHDECAAYFGTSADKACAYLETD